MSRYIVMVVSVTIISTYYTVGEQLVSDNHALYKQGDHLKDCNWRVQLTCSDGLIINITNVTIGYEAAWCSNCKGGCPNVDININEGNTSQKIYSECDGEQRCDTFPPYQDITTNGDSTNVTVFYNCTVNETSTASPPNDSTEGSSNGSVTDIFTSTALTRPSQSSSISTVSSTHVTTTDGTNATPLSPGSTTATTTTTKTNAGSSYEATNVNTSPSITPQDNVTGAGFTTSESGKSGTTYNHSPVALVKGTRKQTIGIVVALSVLAALVGLVALSVLIRIRRGRMGKYPDDKTAVLSASRNASTTDSSDDDNADFHPDPEGANHDNNTCDQSGGYIPGDYSEIEITGDTNDSSEYNTLDLKTFKVVAADPTYNHIGISSSLGANAASPNGRLTMTQDTDSSYATCGETETVLVDNEYSHTNQGFPENERSNDKVHTGTSDYDHVNSFRDCTGAVADDDTYSHIEADEGDIRGKTIVRDVDNYSHVSHVAKSDEGSESQWQMQVEDDNVVSTNEKAQVLQAVSEVERNDNPDDGKTSDSETENHSYFILEKMF